MVERSRPARLREICAPWLVPGLALSAAASAIGVAPEGRPRATARASAEIREAARVTTPVKGAQPSRPAGATVAERACLPGDVPADVRCSLTIVDMP